MLGPKLEPCWPHVRPKLAQDGLEMPPRAAREASRSRLGANSRPRRARTPSRLRFGSFLATLLDNFGQKLDNICHYFGRSYKTRPRPSKYRAPRSLTSGAAVPKALPSSILYYTYYTYCAINELYNFDCIEHCFCFLLLFSFVFNQQLLNTG